MGQTSLSVIKIGINGQYFEAQVSNEIYRSCLRQIRRGEQIIPPYPPLVKGGKGGLREIHERVKIIRCPMPGIVTAVGVKNGDRVKKGDSLLIIEAMKMENEIKAPYNGVIKQINVTQGSMVKLNDELVILE